MVCNVQESNQQSTLNHPIKQTSPSELKKQTAGENWKLHKTTTQTKTRSKALAEVCLQRWLNSCVSVLGADFHRNFPFRTFPKADGNDRQAIHSHDACFSTLVSTHNQHNRLSLIWLVNYSNGKRFPRSLRFLYLWIFQKTENENLFLSFNLRRF